MDVPWGDVLNVGIVERRNGPRLPVSLEISFDDGEQVLSSYLFDLGCGGLFIGTPSPLEEGTRIRLCFHLPGWNDSLTVLGTVIWRQARENSSRPGMGIRFDEMSPEDRERLDAYLMEQLTG